MISERELRIIEEISRDRNLTQRKISHRLGLSLGMTNLILKRLVNKGYVKVRGLNRRKVQYILTPTGFAEKTKKILSVFLKDYLFLARDEEENSASSFNGIRERGNSFCYFRGWRAGRYCRAEPERFE